MTVHLNLKARVLLWHVATVGLILAVAALGADLVFSRMVLGQFDEALLDLAQTEAADALAHPMGPLQINERAPGTALFRRRASAPASELSGSAPRSLTMPA